MAASRRRPRTPPPRESSCSHCGARLPAGARSCRECGSDAETGWKDEEELFLASVDLPEFDEEDYRAAMGEIEGRGSGAARRPRWVLWVTWILLAALALVFLLRG
jgi:hypothetical protein